ncbi:MAG: family 10 glycosylhydrolase [Burkholderiales bacterium]
MLRVLSLAILLCVPSASPSADWSLVRPAESFDRHYLTQPDAKKKIRASHTLSGGAGSWGIAGWVDYDFEVPAQGWYQIKVHGKGAGVDYILDADAPDTVQAEIRVYGTNGTQEQPEKVGNFWLGAGRHTLRLQRYFWTGFPDISRIVIERSSDSLGQSVRIWFENSPPIFAKGQCGNLLVQSGGREGPAQLTAWIWNGSSGTAVRASHLDIPKGLQVVTRKLALPCEQEGYFRIGFGEDGKRIDPSVLRDIGYEVIGTQKAASTARPGKSLAYEIDMVRTAPDYASGPTPVAGTGANAYRQSGSDGWLRFQSAHPSLRKLLPAPSWFAYKLPGLVAQNPYWVEVDYPDDAQRTFAIALREGNPLSYPIAGGVDSGGEFALSNATQTQGLLFWPRGEEVRLALLNAHDGGSAAAARARVYRVEGDLPPMAKPSQGRRHFANWYEEGSNFLSMYGLRDDSALGLQAAAERWASAVAWMGGDVLMPTVSVYSFVLYPSRFNLSFSPPQEQDMLMRLVLTAQKHGLRVLPELHPRADELSWATSSVPDAKARLLVSKDGTTSTSLPPLYNPILPANQDWYVGMIGELAQRYAAYPALMGVSLRLMQWANPALNNFHSLDWGYDDYTVTQFRRETNVAVPLGDPENKDRFGGRYRWLMANAKPQWTGWRCEKIAQLFERIRDRVRSARPDLVVYASAFDAYPSGFGAGWLEEAGICPRRLHRIEGVVLINGLHAYGRRYDRETTQAARDNLTDPAVLRSMSGSGSGAHFLAYARYLEATEAVMPPAQIGLSPNTKQTWMSAAANPAGEHSAERFALALAETDARFLGDGGNGYSLGQEPLRDFLKEYRQIPAVAFRPRADARDPVAVWEHRTQDGFWFYLVNRESYALTVTLDLSGPGNVVHLASGEVFPSGVARRIVLAPYRVLAYKSAPSVSIASVRTDIPPQARALVAARTQWLEEAAKSERESLFSVLNKTQLNRLMQTAEQTRTEFGLGHLWRARTLSEHHTLIPVYRKLGRFPPGLAHLN